MSNKPDHPDYTARKAALGRCLTVYGRHPVLEALQSPGVRCERLHLAEHNRPAAILDQIRQLAVSHGAELREHGRAELARISRNGREDQGVAADVRWPGYRQLADALPLPATAGNVLLAADGITNPQNLGMLIRSAAASGCAGVLLPRQGGCDIGPLVIKASAGALFRASLLRCETLPAALAALREGGWRICVLDAGARSSLFAQDAGAARVFVLGGESQGVGRDVRALADETVAIPLANGVESLNVAVTAALVAFLPAFQRLR